MPSYRCGVCNINYPIGVTQKCRVCKGDLHWLVEEHDEGWAQKVIRLNREHEDGELIPPVDTEIKNLGGKQLWLSSWDVIRSGLHHRLPPGQLVRVGSKTYEILFYVYSLRAYFVRPFETAVTDKALTKWLKPRRKRGN